MISFVAYEVDLEFFGEIFAVFVKGAVFDNPDVYIETPCQKFVVDDVFKQVSLFDLTEIETGIAQSDIGEIVFARGVDVAFAFDIIAFCLRDDKCVLQIADV